MRVRFVNLGAQFDSLRDPILGAIERISHEGAYVLGEEVERFEQSFAQYCGVEYALGVANGTDALVLPMKALGIGPATRLSPQRTRLLRRRAPLCRREPHQFLWTSQTTSISMYP